jgi:hypothetical protein
MAHLRFSLIPLALIVAAPAALAAPRAERDDQVVCKSVERPASRFLHRLCGTRKEWDQLSEQHKGLYSQMQNRPAIMIGK